MYQGWALTAASSLSLPDLPISLQLSLPQIRQKCYNKERNMYKNKNKNKEEEEEEYFVLAMIVLRKA